jgi:hypothetical protein
MKEKEPQVWGNGDVTIALGMKGFRIWIATLPIKYIEKLELHINPKTNKTELELQFESSQDSKIQISIEENIRIAKTISWVKII